MKNGISFVVIAKNEEAMIESSIQTLLQLTNYNYEVILVNSGSTDSTPAIMKKYSDKHASINFIDSTKPGPSAARNEGLKVAKHDYVFFLDGDVELEIGFITIALKEFEESPNTCALAGKLAEKQYTPDYKECTSSSPDRYNRNRKMQVKSFGGIFITKRDSTKEAGLWEEKLFCHEDTDYALRLKRLGQLIVIPVKMGTHKTVQYENRMVNMIKNGYFRGLGIFLKKHILAPTVWVPFLFSHKFLYPSFIILLFIIAGLLFNLHCLFGALIVPLLDIFAGIAKRKILTSWLLSHYVAPLQVLTGFLFGNKNKA